MMRSGPGRRGYGYFKKKPDHRFYIYICVYIYVHAYIHVQYIYIHIPTSQKVSRRIIMINRSQVLAGSLTLAAVRRPWRPAKWALAARPGCAIPIGVE